MSLDERELVDEREFVDERELVDTGSENPWD